MPPTYSETSRPASITLQCASIELITWFRLRFRVQFIVGDSKPPVSCLLQIQWIVVANWNRGPVLFVAVRWKMMTHSSDVIFCFGPNWNNFSWFTADPALHFSSEIKCCRLNICITGHGLKVNKLFSIFCHTFGVAVDEVSNSLYGSFLKACLLYSLRHVNSKTVKCKYS